MSALLSALNKSARKNAPRTLMGQANMVGEVLSYGDATIKVKILSGPIAGQEVEMNPGNKKVGEFKKESKAQTSSYTPVGGILRFDGVRAEADGTFKSTWTNAWIKRPGDDNKLLTEQLVSYYKTNRRTADDMPIVQLNVMDAKNETAVSDFDALQAALAAGFESNQGVMVIDTTEGFETATYRLSGKREGDDYVLDDPQAYAKSLIDDIRADAGVEQACIERMAAGNLTVVPISRLMVGPKSAEEAENAIAKADEAGKKARIMTVNPYAYEAPSLGVRVSGALMRRDRDDKPEIAPEYADRFKQAFLAFAPQSARDALMADGWIGVSDTDLNDFFASKGVALIKAPAQTWNTAAVHLQAYSGSTNFFVAKTHEAARYGNPFPPLECCKDLRATYGAEVKEGIIAVAKSLDAVADVEKDAPVTAKAEAAASAADVPDTPGAVEAQESIDSMLDDLANQDMA